VEGRKKVRCTCGVVLVAPKDATGARMRCPKCGEVIIIEEGPSRAVVWGGVAVVVLVALGVTFFLWHAFRQQRLRSQADLAVRAARSAETSGRWRDALEQYEKALDLFPECPQARRGVERVRPEVEKLEAVERREQAENLLRKAQQAEGYGDLETASDLYRRALELVPDTPEAHDGLARVTAAIEKRERERQQREEAEQLRREAKEKERRIREKLTEERRAKYLKYKEKTRAFYESLLETESALEVGINYLTYMERVREMNFEAKKWEDALGGNEPKFPSALAMKLALAYYVLAGEFWKRQIDSEYEILLGEMQQCWQISDGLIQMARLCMDGEDLVSELPCKVCGCTGKIPCANCSGTGKCPLCEGSGICDLCHGTGRFVGDKCFSCKGTGKCSRCSGTGKCKECGGSGKKVCPLCEGAMVWPPKALVRME